MTANPQGERMPVAHGSMSSIPDQFSLPNLSTVLCFRRATILHHQMQHSPLQKSFRRVRVLVLRIFVIVTGKGPGKYSFINICFSITTGIGQLRKLSALRYIEGTIMIQ